MLLEGSAHDGASAVQQHTLVARTDPEHVSDLLRRQSLHIAQRYDDPLSLGQIGEGGVSTILGCPGSDWSIRPFIFRAVPCLKDIRAQCSHSLSRARYPFGI